MILWPRLESNQDFKFRKLTHYPLYYGAILLQRWGFSLPKVKKKEYLSDDYLNKIAFGHESTLTPKLLRVLQKAFLSEAASIKNH